MNSFLSSGDALEALVLGVALAMDAMAVTLSNSLCEPDMPTSKKLAMPVLFALFQMAMPIAGFFGGTLVAPLIEAYAGIVSLVILGFVGGKMIWEAVQELREPEQCPTTHLTYPTIFFEAIATSIDAFIVGVSLAVDGVSFIILALLPPDICRFIIFIITRTSTTVRIRGSTEAIKTLSPGTSATCMATSLSASRVS